MLRKLIGAAAAIAMLTGTAVAQMNPLMPSLSLQGEKTPRTPEQKERDQAIDDAYKAASKKIPEKKVNDPWATVRSSPNSSAASKQ